MRLELDNIIVVIVTLVGAVVWVRLWLKHRSHTSVAVRLVALMAAIASFVLCCTNIAFIIGEGIPEVNGWFAASQFAMALTVTMIGVVVLWAAGT